MSAGMRIRLKLFGSPSIAGEDGTLISGRAVQRHRLALLALLALSGGSGARRDKLQGLLWPESDTEHARQLLNQAVYNLRKALGEGAIVSLGEELRLNAQLVDCDVQAFEQALAAGELERAAQLYAGPVLDGLFLSDAPEFERWLDGTRARLTDALARALESLADRAEAELAFGKAAEYWKARAIQDPYDSRVAVRLMRALAAAGNRAGAIQHAAAHQRLLEQEFDAEPDPEVWAYAERLRREPDMRTESPVDRITSRSPDADVSAPTETVRLSVASPGHTATLPSPRFGVRWRYRTLVFSAVFVSAMALWIDSATDTPATTGTSSLAVLPFRNLSTDPRDAVLSDGMTDALIAMLARSNGLRVPSSTSVFALRDQALDIQQIADTLDVASLLEGSVQRLGAILRVRVRLIDARDASTLWSASYDRDFSDILAVQEEIAHAITSELGLQLAGVQAPLTARQPTQSVAAYEFFLRGSDRSLFRSDSTTRLGLGYFQNAIALDSGYAAAWAGLGKMYLRLAATVPQAQRDEYLAQAQAATSRALGLDDNLAEAHVSAGLLRMHAFDFVAGEEHLMRAAVLDPSSAMVHEYLVSLYLWRGRFSEALTHAERAVELDPLSPTAHAELARALIGNDRCEEALATLRPLSSLQTPLLRVAPMTAECLARQQRWDDALAVLRPQLSRTRRYVAGLVGYLVARTGRRDEAIGIRDTLIHDWEQGHGSAFEVLVVSVGLGEIDDAFVWADRAVEDRSLAGAPGAMAALSLHGPLMNDFRADPRFGELRARIGLGER